MLPGITDSQSSQKPTRGYQKSGLYGAKRALQQFGERAIDGRTGAGPRTLVQ